MRKGVQADERKVRIGTDGVWRNNNSYAKMQAKINEITINTVSFDINVTENM